jgi:hypothetical protein
MRRPGASVTDYSRLPKLVVVNETVSAPSTQVDLLGAMPSPSVSR